MLDGIEAHKDLKNVEALLRDAAHHEAVVHGKGLPVTSACLCGVCTINWPLGLNCTGPLCLQTTENSIQIEGRGY